MADGITASDIGGDQDIAMMILIRARAIAPEVRTVGEGAPERAEALAILKSVAKRAAEAGTGAIASKGRNGTTISLREVKRVFAGEYESLLRLVFHPELDLSPRPMPRGSFPPDLPLSRLFPEGPYS